MTEVARFFLLGLGAGGIYALVALGIVLVYRGSGVVNFAHGVLALTAAATFFELRDLFGTPAALAVGVVAAAASGVVVNLAVMVPMRRSSPLARVIATLALVALGTEPWKHRLGVEGFRRVEPFLPDKAVEPFGHGIVVGEDRLWILAITGVLTAVLWVLYRRSRFGLATAAVAEDEAVAAAQGWSPVAVATVNWALGGALAGLGGIVLATVAGLSPTGQTLVVVPALAAALVGGFSSFPGTLAGGLLVGVVEAEALHLANPTGFSRGLETAVPFAVVVAILVLRGRPLPLRSFLADRLPSVGTGRISRVAVTALLVSAVGSLWAFSVSWTAALTTSAIAGLVALSLVVVTGYAGQLSLAQWALAGIGALFGGRLAADVWGLPFPVAAVVGIGLSVPVGVVVALPALRVRGVSLAVTTLALSVVLGAMVLNNDRYTGGLIRGTVVPPPRVGGWDISAVAHPERYGAVAVAVFALAGLAVANVRRGRTGRRLIAVRDNERAAASLGVGVVEAKLYAFALSSALAAAAGVLVAFRNPRLSFAQFNLFGNVNAVLYATLGGIGWVGGAAVAGLAQAEGGLAHVLRHVVEVRDWYLVGASIALLVTVISRPDGVFPDLVDRRTAIGRRRRPTAVSAPLSPRPSAGVRRVPPKALQLEDLQVRFGGVVALDGVSLAVAPGEVVGLIGPNGAGKTTLIDAASGFVAYRGSVRLGDTRLDGCSPRARAKAGLTRSFQSLELFEDLSVGDNLAVAADDGRRWVYAADLLRPSRTRMTAAAVAAIEDFGLSPVLDLRPAELPYAQRRMVAIARAVASSPSVLLLDEPAAGLDDWATAELTELVRRLARDWGMGVLLVEHDVGMVMDVCDRVVVLDFGRVIAVGSPAEVRGNRAVVTAYLGDVAGGGPDVADADVGQRAGFRARPQ